MVSFFTMRRRDFITVLGGAAALLPVAMRAQPSRVRRIGVLMSTAEQDPLGQAWRTAFQQGLKQFGWDDRNTQIDYRWGASDRDLFRKYAAELVALGPDVILGTAASIVADLQQASRTIPIVFVTTIDPVGSGLVASLARPGGNATGFTAFEFSLSAKLLELLKQIAPSVTRVAVVRDPSVSAGLGGFAAIQTAAHAFNVELTPVGIRAADEIERGLTDFARQPNGGLIVVGPPSSLQPFRQLIANLAAQQHLPAVYATLAFVGTGALVSYGEDIVDQYRRGAEYVDRILKGEKPADLPVQAPTKYRLVVNLKTAKAIGLTVPPSLLATADEVIE
jgi:putative tryptophan/tyrosine transport system substrate-binding protein